jgi:thiamine pyrophosphokinase
MTGGGQGSALARALVLADGTPPSRNGLDVAWPGWDDAIGYVVAADGGARLAVDLGLKLDRWVGDGDSIDPEALAELRRQGVPIDLVRQDKDESDTELALLAAVAVAGDVTILGALGGRRIDHSIANLGLLAHPALADHRVRLLDDRSRVTLLQGGHDGHVPNGQATHRLDGREGDLVSLLPMGERVEGVTTTGLEYALRDETLAVGPARGLSNVRLAGQASVTIRSGRLLIVETPATLNP